MYESGLVVCFMMPTVLLYTHFVDLRYIFISFLSFFCRYVLDKRLNMGEEMGVMVSSVYLTLICTLDSGCADTLTI